MIDYASMLSVLSGGHPKFITIEDTLDQTFFNFAKEYGSKKILGFFVVNEIKGLTYKCVLACSKCQSEFVVWWTKTDIEKHIQDLFVMAHPIETFAEKKRASRVRNVLCSECHKAQKLKDSIQAEKDNEVREENFRIFIEKVCNPSCKWDDSVDGFSIILNRVSFGGASELKESLLKLSYSDFLKTPYWTAVAFEVKRRSKFKCALCPSKQNLNAHHRSYERHGEEHTYHGLKELICLCNDCHKKHHDKIESKNER